MDRDKEMDQAITDIVYILTSRKFSVLEDFGILESVKMIIADHIKVKPVISRTESGKVIR